MSRVFKLLAMTRLERVTKNISENKEVRKRLTDAYNGRFQDLLEDAAAFVKATKEKRMCCIIDTVSASGMSRTLKFTSCEKGGINRYYYRSYYSLFVLAGYTAANKRSTYFRVTGCGMDMVFATNYDIMNFLKEFGIISDKDWRYLSQRTPQLL